MRRHQRHCSLLRLALAGALLWSFGYQRSVIDYAQAHEPTGSDIVALAQQQLGAPSVYGGASPAGFDCSGLMQYVFAQVGIALPRTAAAQAQIGTPVALTALAPGDLVFFDFGQGVDHVALSVGNGWLIHAPAPGTTVEWAVVWSDAWWPHAVSARRILPMVNTHTSLPVVGPPSVSRDQYRRILCTPRHGQVPPPCAEAGAMYDLLVQSGLDPAVQLAFALKETEFGTTGPGRAPQRNLHNLECNDWDGGSCTGPYHYRFAAYPSYTWATWAWATLLLTRGRYVDVGNGTVEQILPIYAPPFENDTADYIAFVQQHVTRWRGQTLPDVPPPPPTPTTTATPTPEPAPLARPHPCGTAVLTQDAPRLTAPHPDAEHLGFLLVDDDVTILCRDGEPVTTTDSDGMTWQLVDSGDVTFTWIARDVLKPLEETDDTTTTP